jgi:hypothetical protein
MNKYFLWKQLLVEQKINVMCNTLAKWALSRAIRIDRRREGIQLLPSKDWTVFVNNRKLTRDLTKAVQYEAGKEKYCEYLTSCDGWTDEQFDKLD